MEEQQAEEARELEYSLYRDHFRAEISDGPSDAIRRRTNDILIEFRTSLDRARSEILEITGAGTNARFTAFVMAYRTIEWYRTEVLNAFLAALAEPFAVYFSNFKDLKPRLFFAPKAADALFEASLTEVFKPEDLPGSFKKFLDAHRKIRHDTVHGIYFPSLQEAKSCVRGAIEIYNTIDEALNPSTPAALDDLDSET